MVSSSLRRSSKLLQEFKHYPLTYIIILLNIAIYFLVALSGSSFIDLNTRLLVDWGALYGPVIVAEGAWWRLLSAMFLHGGMTHLLMNMVSLYLVGRGLESYFSRGAYLSIYLFSGLIGGLVSLYIHPVSVGIGASGAIFGVFGALAGFFLAHRDRIGDYTKAFMKDFIAVLGLNLFIGLAIPSVDMSAHIGGLLVGLVAGYLLAKKPAMLWIVDGAMVFLVYAGIQVIASRYVQIPF